MMPDGMYEIIPLAKIVSVVDNHRQAMDQQKLQELADSIAAIGVQQPIKVCRRDDGRWSMVFGHRRVAASKLAGLETIPAIIVTGWTVQQIAEAQVVENLLREDLTPIEEALCVQTLLDGGIDLETAASKMNKSTVWARQRHDLLRLADAVQSLVATGRLPLGHAKLIARVGDKKDQVELAHDVIGYHPWIGAKDLQRAVAGDHVAPLKDLRQSISYRLCKLGAARWPKDVKYAGRRPCDGCTDNTNTEPVLFTGITLTSKRGNCTNPKCFAVKAKAWEKDPVKRERDKKRDAAKRKKAVAAGDDPDAAAAAGKAGAGTGTGQKARKFPGTPDEHLAVRLYDHAIDLLGRIMAHEPVAADVDVDDADAVALHLAYTATAHVCQWPGVVKLDDPERFALAIDALTEALEAHKSIEAPTGIRGQALAHVRHVLLGSQPRYFFNDYASAHPHEVHNVPLSDEFVKFIDCLDAVAARWNVAGGVVMMRPTAEKIAGELRRAVILTGKRDAATAAIAECADAGVLQEILVDFVAGRIKKLAKWRHKAIADRAAEIQAAGVEADAEPAGEAAEEPDAEPATCCVCGKLAAGPHAAKTSPDMGQVACSGCIYTIAKGPKREQQAVTERIAAAPAWLLEKLAGDGLRGDWRRGAVARRLTELQKGEHS